MRWYDSDEIRAILDQPADDYLARLTARNDALFAARTQRLLDADNARLLAELHAEEMARYDGEETNPIEIDRERLEEWYDSQQDIPY